MDVFESLAGFSERQPEIDHVSKTERHDMLIVLVEFQG